MSATVAFIHFLSTLLHFRLQNLYIFLIDTAFNKSTFHCGNIKHTIGSNFIFAIQISTTMAAAIYHLCQFLYAFLAAQTKPYLIFIIIASQPASQPTTIKYSRGFDFSVPFLCKLAFSVHILH